MAHYTFQRYSVDQVKKVVCRRSTIDKRSLEARKSLVLIDTRLNVAFKCEDHFAFKNFT